MLKGSCHCGAVNFELNHTPDWLSKCNCSLCRRLGVIWGHGDTTNTTFRMSQDATITYIWGDKTIEFHTCKTCGCTTHYIEIADKEKKHTAINCMLVDPTDIEDIRIRMFDGADTWKFLD